MHFSKKKIGPEILAFGSMYICVFSTVGVFSTGDIMSTVGYV